MNAKSKKTTNWFLENTKALRNKKRNVINEPNYITKRRQAAIERLRNISFPDTRMEEYRFTDLSELGRVSLATPVPVETHLIKKILKESSLEKECPKIVIVDGLLDPNASHCLDSLDGLYIGNLSMLSLNEKALHKITSFDSLAALRGTPFALLNSATAEDIVFIIAEPGITSVEIPLHLIIMNSADRKNSTVINCSMPRIFIWAGDNTSLEIIEEYVTVHEGCHLTNSVMEAFLSRGAKVYHRYVQMEARSGKNYHLKSTLIEQEEGSHYECTEVNLGAQISRHDLSIYQRGPDTTSVLGHFLLAGSNQIRDLHSRVGLRHRNGRAEQLHKCIVTSSSGRGVFDGNFELKQKAAKTDACQLSRNLLVNPKGTVNVKPNLQIAADDVRCTHGCTVSDLVLDEIFYFATRGIDEHSTRQALVFSFGTEIVERLNDNNIKKRINKVINEQLTSANQLQ
jgi:Fe-S cluster assembly protein SufD